MRRAPMLVAVIAIAGLLAYAGWRALRSRRPPQITVTASPAPAPVVVPKAALSASTPSPSVAKSVPQPLRGEAEERERLQRRESELAALPSPSAAERDELLATRVVLRYARSVLDPSRLGKSVV